MNKVFMVDSKNILLRTYTYILIYILSEAFFLINLMCILILFFNPLQGYIRQALYACKTCCHSGTRAAICLAWLLQAKEDGNIENVCNQNYDGLYCTWSRTCSDPQAKDENSKGSTLLQCCICEDWSHLKVRKTFLNPLHNSLFKKQLNNIQCLILNCSTWIVIKKC